MKAKINFDDKVDPSGKIENGNTKMVVYLDSTVNAIHYWEKNDVKHGDTVVADLCGHVLQHQSAPETSSFPPECRLCVQVFKRLENEFGKKCWLDFGAANVPFIEIIKHQRSAIKKSVSSSSLSEWFVMPLKMHTVSANTMSLLKICIVDDISIDSTVQAQAYGSAQPLPFPFSENSIFITARPFDLNYDEYVSNDSNIQRFLPASTTTATAEPEHDSNTKTKGELSSPMLIFDSASRWFDEGVNEQVSERIGRIFHASSTSTASGRKRRGDGLNRLVFEKHQFELYFKEYSKENAYFKDWISGANNINCPFYPSQVTIMDSQVFLPYVAYAIYEPSLVSSVFWMDALKIMSSRRGFSNVDDYCDFFFSEKATLENRAIHAMDMVCQLAHTMEYIADQVVDPVTREIKKIEIFGDALFTFDGDCDDLASVVFQLFDDFSLRQRFVENVSCDSPTIQNVKRVLNRMQSLLKRYVPFMCIEGVTSASAQNQHDIEKTEITGAHAAIKCLPIWYVKKCIANWNPSHPIVDTSLSYDVNVSHVPGGPFNYLPFVDKRASSAKKEEGGGEDYEEWEKKLPVLIGEGTGMLNSGGEPDPCTQAGFRKFVYSCKATKCSKKHLYPPKGTSPFYKAILFASTNRFINDFKIGTFRFCQKDPHRRHKESETATAIATDDAPEFCRGVLFSDLIHMSETVALIPYGDARDIVNDKKKKKAKEDEERDYLMPTTATTPKRNGEKKTYFEFSDTQLHILKETLKTRLKPKPIVSASPSFDENNAVILFENVKRSTPAGNNGLSSSLDSSTRRKIEESIGFVNLRTLKYNLSMNVSSNWGLSDEERRERSEITIYYGDDYVTEEMCRDLYAYFKKKNVLLDFCMENHSSTVWQWRLTFKGLF